MFFLTIVLLVFFCSDHEDALSIAIRGDSLQSPNYAIHLTV